MPRTGVRLAAKRDLIDDQLNPSPKNAEAKNHFIFSLFLAALSV